MGLLPVFPLCTNTRWQHKSAPRQDDRVPLLMRRSLRLWLAPNKQAGDCDVHRCACIVSLLWQDKWQTSNISYEKCFSPQDWTEILRNHHKPVLWQVAFHQTPNVIYFISLSEGWQGWGARLSDESPLHTTNRSFQNVCVLVRVFTVIFPSIPTSSFTFMCSTFTTVLQLTYPLTYRVRITTTGLVLVPSLSLRPSEMTDALFWTGY